jgi:vacuolar protein sorting-associated protein 54
MNAFKRSSFTRSSSNQPEQGSNTKESPSFRLLPRHFSQTSQLNQLATGTSSPPSPSSKPIPTSTSQLLSLSGVLNDPKAPKFSKLDLGGAHIPSVSIKKVRMNEFDPYMKSLAGYYERYEFHRQSGLEAVIQGAPKLKPSKSSKERNSHGKGSPLAIHGVQEELDSPAANLYTILGVEKKVIATPTTPAPPTEPLHDIPEVYFDPGFSLENPSIFDSVTRSVELDCLDESQSLIAHHMDTVESHLVKEISERSSSFFTALSNLNTLHDETSVCVQQIQRLHQHLHELSLVHSKKALETVYLTQRKQNIARIHDTIRRMHEIRQAHPMIQMLLQQGDYVGALNLIVDSSISLQGLGSSDLKGIKAMNNFKSKLVELGKTVGGLMQTEFTELVVSYLKGTILLPTEDMQQRLLPLVIGLLRMDGMVISLQTYQDRLLTEIKAKIKSLHSSEFPFVENISNQPGPSNRSKEKDAAKEKDSPFAKSLKALSLEKFLNSLNSVFQGNLEIIKRVMLIQSVIEGCLQESDRQNIKIGVDKPHAMLQAPAQPQAGSIGPKPTSEEENDNSGGSLPDPKPIPLVLNLSAANPTAQSFISVSLQVAHTAVDLCHTRCSKLIALRSEQNAQLSLKDYQRLVSLINGFVASTETSVRGYVSAGLKSALQTQSRGFITHFHMERMKQLATLVENELWTQTDVLIDFQAFFDHVVDMHQSTTRDDSKSKKLGMAPASSSGSLNSSPSKLLYVGNDKFPVASVVLIFGKMVSEYLTVLDSIPSLALDVNQKLLELSKTFNSRVCQMILGAGAVQSAGLKSITAKHLGMLI